MDSSIGIVLLVVAIFVLYDLSKYGSGSGVYVRSDDQWKAQERGSGGEW